MADIAGIPYVEAHFDENGAIQNAADVAILCPVCQGKRFRPEVLVSEVADSGRRHVNYGVHDRDYDDVGAALLWAIDQSLGDRSTPARLKPL